MTGATHGIAGAATVGTVLVLAERLRGTGAAGAPGEVALLAGLLALGTVAALFPDLDAPASELSHAPQKLARGARRVAGGLVGRRGLVGGGVQLVLALAGGVLGGLIGLLGAAIRACTTHRGWTHTLSGLLVCTSLVTAATAGLVAPFTGAAAMIAPAVLVGAVWALGYLTHLLADAATPHGVPFWRGRIFHLVPRGWRIRTGSLLDTLVIRGAAWGWFGLLLVAAAHI